MGLGRALLATGDRRTGTNTSSASRTTGAVSKGTPASKFLAPEIYGGQRGQKRSERALTRYAPPDVKRAMGNRGYWVPGPGLTLNAYGNVSGSTMVQILSDLKAFGEVGLPPTGRPSRPPQEAPQGSPLLHHGAPERKEKPSGGVGAQGRADPCRR
jgi:hypothetical protein